MQAAEKSGQASKGAILLTSLLVGGVQMIITMDITTMGVLLPSINQTFPVSQNALGGMFSYSALVFACFMLLGGKLADKIGYRLSVSLGLAIVGIGATLSTLAPTFDLLIVSRIFYGLGSAIMIPANFAIINTAIPEGAARQRAYSIFAVVQGAAQFIGPALGGFLAGSIGWRAFFGVNAIFIAVLVVLCFLKLPESERNDNPFDRFGPLLFVPAIALMVLGLSGGSGLVDDVTLRVAMAVGGLSLMVAFIRRQTRVAHPFVPPAIWQHEGIKPGFYAMLALMAGSSALFILPALVMQRALGMSPGDAGLGMLPHAISATITGQMIGFFMARFSLRKNVLIGLSVTAIGLFMNGWMQPGWTYVTAVMVPMIVGASGSIFSVMMLSALLVGPQRATDQGVASAIIFTLQQIGVSLGSAGILALSAVSDDPLTSYNYGFLAASAVIVSGLIAVVFSRSKPPINPPHPEPILVD